MTDDVLDRIDQAVAGWEVRPESWLPGDPLHPHPYTQPANDDGTFQGNYPRPMIQVLDDDQWSRARCEPCDVSWSGIGSCWMCGQYREPTSRGLGAAGDQRFLTQMLGFGAAVRAAADFEHAMSRFAAVSADYARRVDEMFLRRLDDDPVARHTNAPCFVLPAVANPAAPTMAELEAGQPLGEVVLGFDFTRDASTVVVARRTTRGGLFVEDLQLNTIGGIHEETIARLEHQMHLGTKHVDDFRTAFAGTPRPWMFDNPRPLPIDGHAYHRRRRNRP
ncbi:hypothetical protein [Nocardioides sp. InS609-2]|uniref:hypothetical protein n=1 Tax=Nocardioides sp. InS609-2 TaxID=2760705 RepID=UPI0020BF28F4|nr:hypothetical protein [Nocardioides sp. InS609-2]